MVIKMKKKLFSAVILVTLLASVLPSLPVMASPGPSLVGSWNFDEGAGSTAGDSSGYGNHGTLLPSNEGKFGGALSFDGVNDYVMVADSPTLEPTMITVELWVQATSSHAYEYILTKFLPPTATDRASYAFYTGSSGGLRFYVGTTSTYYASPDAGTGIWNGNWHHIAGTFDGSEVRLYVDGTKIDGSTSDPNPIWYQGTGDLYIGTYNPAITVPPLNLYFQGKIDEVRISDNVRYTIPFAPPTAPFTPDSNTVALWHFDEETSQTINDSAGSNHGIRGSSNVVEPSDPTWLLAGPTWVPGKVGTALYFDGFNDYVEVPDSGSLDVDHITIDAWISLADPIQTSVGNIVRKGYYGERCYGLSLNLRQQKRVTAWVNLGPDGNGIAKEATGTTDLQPNTWYHVAMTYDGTNVRFYLDGDLQSTSASTSGNIYDNALSVRIGGQASGDNPGALAFKGKIDEVNIWNGVWVLPLKLNFLDSSHSIVQIGVTATLNVRLTDDNGNPVEGIPITFSSTPALTFTPSKPNTDNAGVATTTTSTSTAGLFTITATAETPFGPVSDTWTLVVYDTQGMAAGGGWYYPKADDETDMEGRATFGFVAKYIKGASTGNLEFQYHSSNGFNLKSTTIDYLVVSGANAKFGGKATVDGVPGYFFRVLAQDVAEPGVGKDMFDIKIWFGDPNLGGTLSHSSHNVLSGGNIMVKIK